MSREQMIHDAAMEIMRDVGVNIHNEKRLKFTGQTASR